MRLASILAISLLLSGPLAPDVGAQSATRLARPVRGLVTLVHEELRMLGVGPMTFLVPEDVLDFDEVEEGLWATVSYRKRGDTLLATSVELDDRSE